MSLSISSSTLLAYYQAKDGITTTTGSSAAANLAASAPAAPWTSAGAGSTSAIASTSTNALVAKLLSGTSIIDPSAVKLSTTSSTNSGANTDYQGLFALYQGLTSLQSLAAAAGASGVSSSQLAQYEKAFTNGLTQVRDFVASDPFDEFQLANGKVSTSTSSTTGAQQDSSTYDSGPLVTGSTNTVVASLQGDVAFSLTSTNVQGAQTSVNFDLSQMGSTPRTLSNVVSYLNSTLQAAGLKTRFGTNLIPGAAATTETVNGQTITIPGSADQYGLAINGTPNELLSFSAASSAPAVYVAQNSSDPSITSSSSTTTTTTTASSTTSGTSTAAPAVTGQVIKLDSPASGATAPTRGFTDNLPDGATVAATATAPDGSVYVLANVTSPISGQSIQGTQDAALLKYDSAGNLVYTRTLGAADTATGTSLAISADGTQVAIAGSITGSTLDPTDTSDAGSTTAQSFVQVYDSAGDELWNNVQDATSDNTATAVAFGANNSVYVAGTTQGRLPGATSSGSQDAYVQGFNVATVVDTLAQQTTYTATTAFTTEYGTSGVDRAAGLVVQNGTLYAAGVENGDAVVRSFSLTNSLATTTANSHATTTTSKTTATASGVQDLGALSGGDVTGLAVTSDGSLVVGGSTHNAALAGNVTAAYSGNGDAFVAELGSNLSPQSVAYYNGGAPTTATGLAVSGDTAYITGQLAGASKTSIATGYAAGIDLSTGQTSWSGTFTGNNGSAEPASIGVSANGASALDLLGLPTGAVQQQNPQSALVVSNSSVRAGDKFYVQTGGGTPTAVTIAADDTYSTLAKKIAQASNFQAAVTTITVNGQQEIRIAPAFSTSEISLEAGPGGQDALAPLGLQEGLVTQSANTTTAASTATTINTANGQIAASNVKSQYSLTLASTLSLANSTNIAATQQALSAAITQVQSIYNDLTTAKTSTLGSGGGTAPAYITAQLANYQLALQRLGGSSSTGSSSSAALAILGG